MSIAIRATARCGQIRKEILVDAGRENCEGWAFGIGLERIAMILFEVLRGFATLMQFAKEGDTDFVDVFSTTFSQIMFQNSKIICTNEKRREGERT